MPDGTNNEINIGILVVHGIGDQKQFDCLRGTAQSIVNSLKSEIDSGYVEVSVDINRATTGTFQSPHPAWQDGEKASINIRIKPNGRYSKIYNLHLREVLWADLDRPQNISKFIKFWFWGLSLWAIPPQDSNLPILNDPDKNLKDLSWDEDSEDRNLKKNLSRRLARLEYSLIGLFLIVCQPILFVVKTIFRLADWDIPLTIIADYVGKLRLYQTAANSGKDLIEDIGNPPRFSIQRRMINALARMAISDYDRWYVWSHSLGSIVAYNAFSMPEATLSHYITEQMWEEITAFDLVHANSEQLLHDINDNDKRRPRPYRPVWQQQRISKKTLFSKCEGLLTYGSPFWRIADLWPDLVKRNIKADFQPNFNWYNVIDPSDPVATRIAELFPNNPEQQQDDKSLKTLQSLHPQDIFYRTPKPFLLAHTSYLSSSQKNKNSLINQLYLWATEDKKLNGLSPWEIFHKNVPEKELRRWYLRYHQVWRFVWWFGLIFLFYTLFLNIIWEILTINYQNVSTFFISMIEKLYIHFHDDYWLNSSLHYFLKPLTYSFYWIVQLIEYLKISSIINSFISILKESYYVFLDFLNAFGLTHAILQLFPNPNLFLFFLGLLISSGLIRSLRGNPVKSYILEFLQDRPNERFNQQDLEKEFKGNEPATVANFLEQLVKNKEILKDEENYKYFFPSYTFDFGIEEDWNYANSVIYEMNQIYNQSNPQIRQTNKIQTFYDLKRYVIDQLKFDPRYEIQEGNKCEGELFLDEFQKVGELYNLTICTRIPYVVNLETYSIRVYFNLLEIS